MSLTADSAQLLLVDFLRGALNISPCVNLCDAGDLNISPCTNLCDAGDYVAVHNALGKTRGERKLLKRWLAHLVSCVPALVIPIIWLSRVIKGDVHDMAYQALL